MNYLDHSPTLLELAVLVTQRGSPAGWDRDEVSHTQCHLLRPYFLAGMVLASLV